MTPNAVLELVRARHPLAAVARRSGLDIGERGDWMVPCPLPDHDDGTPSMMLHLDSGRYHCFGCGAHGDVIQWVRDIEGVPLGEARRILDSGRPIAAVLAAGARSHASAADAYRRAERPDLSRTGREQVVAAVESAWGYYTWAKLHRPAVSYLAQRGIDVSPLEAETAAPVAGHTPARPDGLMRRMRASGFSDDDLVDAGLALRFADGRVIDFFRDRVILPVADGDGRLVGLIGRYCGPDPAGKRIPKYLNMPATAAYDKKTAIYRPSRPRLHPGEASVVVCEGTLDALAIAAQAATSGVSHLYAPVSTSGLSLSTIQVATVMAIHPQPPVVAGDGDPSGQTQGSLKWATAFLAAGRQCVVVPWPEGEDPASWIAKHGEEGLMAVTRKGCLHSHPGEVRPRHVGEFLTRADIERADTAWRNGLTSDVARVLAGPDTPAERALSEARRVATNLDLPKTAELVAGRSGADPDSLVAAWNHRRTTALSGVFERVAINMAALRSNSAKRHYAQSAAPILAPSVVEVAVEEAADKYGNADRVVEQVAAWGARLGEAGRGRFAHVAAGALGAAGVGDPFMLQRRLQAAMQTKTFDPFGGGTDSGRPRDLAYQATC